jgi:hypothetical protein
MYCSLRNDFLLQFWDTLGTISRAGEPKRLDGLDIAVRVGDLFCLCHEISGGLALRPLTQHFLLVLSAHQPHFIPQSENLVADTLHFSLFRD